jgi:L-cystine uptake protein TcyP (sodium:dicarboxylate symporter family)
MSIRDHRIFGLAIFDLVTAILGMILLFLLAWKIHFPKLDWWKFVLAGLILAIPFGIIIHVIFGVNTKLNYKLGLSNSP